MFVHISETFLRFVDAGMWPTGTPPQGGISAGKLLEPFMALPKQLRVSRMLNVIFKLLDGLPYRHIHKESIVAKGPQVNRVSFRGLQPPNKPRAAIG